MKSYRRKRRQANRNDKRDIFLGWSKYYKWEENGMEGCGQKKEKNKKNILDWTKPQ